jgi:uncharacterized phage protein (TIGR02220 family)
LSNKELWAQGVELLGEGELTRRFRVWMGQLIKKELIKKQNSDPDEFFLNQCSEIIVDLNDRTGRRFTLTNEAKGAIRAIIASGYQVNDFIKVHEVMCARWLGDPKMEEYLQPSTLYRKGKFDERLALWYAEQRKKNQATLSERKENSDERKEKREKRKDDREEIIAKLMSREWWEFETWAEFMKWTCQLPDAEAIEAYPMPKRIREMRQAPKMTILCLTGKTPVWAEEEYCVLKNDVGCRK